MGNCCAACGGYSRVDTEESDDETTSLFRSRKGRRDKMEQYTWEQKVMTDTIMKSGKVSHAVIASLSDGQPRAVGPRSFRPDLKGIKDVINALNGNTSGISKRGIALGSGTKVNTPGKLDEGKAIYASDGKGGGCTVFKSKVSVLIVFYDNDPATATRLASEVAEHMEEQGH